MDVSVVYTGPVVQSLRIRDILPGTLFRFPEGGIHIYLRCYDGYVNMAAKPTVFSLSETALQLKCVPLYQGTKVTLTQE